MLAILQCILLNIFGSSGRQLLLGEVMRLRVYYRVQMEFHYLNKTVAQLRSFDHSYILLADVRVLRRLLIDQ